MKKNLLLLCFLAVCFNVKATDYYWVGGSTTIWGATSSAWKTGGYGGTATSNVPGIGDVAHIGNGTSNATVTLNANYTIDSLDLEGSGMIFLNGPGKYLTVTGNVLDKNTNVTGGGTVTIRMTGSSNTLTCTSTTGGVGKLPNLTLLGNISLFGKITIGGSAAFIDSGATITPGTSTLVFYYNNTIKGNITLHNAEFQGTNCNFTISDSITLTGNLTISSSAQGFINGGKIKLDSNLIYTNTYPYYGGTGTIVMEGSANQTYSCSGSGGFCNWQIKKSGGTVTPLSGTTTIALASFILSAGSFTAPTGNMIFVPGTNVATNIYIQSTGTTFNANGGTVEFMPVGNGNTYMVTTIPSTRFYNVVYYSLLHPNPANITTATGDTVKIKNNFTHTQGYLNGIWEVKGNLTVGATANQGVGTIIMDSTINATYTYLGTGGAIGTCFLTINKGSGDTVKAQSGTTQLEIAGLNIVGGVFKAPSGTLHIGQSYNNTISYTLFQQTGGAFINNHGLVQFMQNGNGTTSTVAALATTHFNNLEIKLATNNYTPSITTASGDTITVDSAFYHTSGYLLGNWKVNGNLIISTTSNAATGNIFMVGSSNATYSFISGSGTSFLTINKSGGAQVSASSGTTNLQIGALTIVDGTFNAPKNTLFLGQGRDGSNYTLFKQTGGTFNADSDLVKFNQVSNGGTFTVYVNNSTRFYNVESALTQGNYPPHLVSATGDSVYVMNNFTMTSMYIDGIWKVYGNITINSGFDGGTNQVIVAGANAQTFTSSGVGINKLIMNKSGGTFTLNNPLPIYSSLTLTNGIITGNGNLLTLNNGATVSGASDSSFVSGPVKKVGNAKFKFPIGDTTTHHYKPVSISAPSSTSDAYTAQYYNTGLTNSLDGVLTYADPCEYWNLTHTAGSGSPVHDTLFWNNPCFHIASLSYLKIGYVSGSTLTSVGTCTTAGNPTLGNIAGVALGDLTLAKTNPLVYAHAGSDTTILCGSSPVTLGAAAVVTGGTSPFTYSWSPTTGLSSSTTAKPLATPTVTTTYALTVTDNLTEYGKDTVVVTVHPTLIAHAGRDTAIYTGLSVRIGGSASGGASPYTYAWSPSIALSTIDSALTIADPLTTTSYVQTVTDANSCVAKDTMVLTINPIPVDILERIAGSTYIFEGSVVNSTSYWSNDRGHIYTANTIQISQILKGEIECGTVELITKGGTVDSVTENVSHALHLKTGDAGVFLSDSSDLEPPATHSYTETNHQELGPPFEDNSFVKYWWDGEQTNASDMTRCYGTVDQIYAISAMLTDLTWTTCSSEESIYLKKKSHPKDTTNVVKFIPTQNNPQGYQNFINIVNEKREKSKNNPRLRDDVTIDYTMSDAVQFGGNSNLVMFNVNVGSPDGHYLNGGVVHLEYDTAKYGSYIATNGDISVLPGTMIEDGNTYTYDIYNDNYNEISLYYNAITPIDSSFSIDLSELSDDPQQLFQVLISIVDCNSTGDISFTDQEDMRYLAYYSLFPDVDTIPGFYDDISATQTISFGACDTTVISHFSPETIDGGVGEVLTIRGHHFGRSKTANANLYFKNADNDGTTEVAPNDGDYVLWSDTLIKVVIPSVSNITAYGSPPKSDNPIGSGTFRIVTDSGVFRTTEPLTVRYSVINQVLGSGQKKADLLSGPNNNGYIFYVDTAIWNHPQILACIKKALREWNCLTGVNWEVYLFYTLPFDSVAHRDKVNFIHFGKTNQSGSIVTLALTSSFTKICTLGTYSQPYTTEIDMVISNNSSVAWDYDTTGTTLPNGKDGFLDVVMHELGHAHSLNHVNDKNAIMYYQYPPQGASAIQRKINLANDVSCDFGGNKVRQRSVDSLPLCSSIPSMTPVFNCTPFTNGVATILENNEVVVYPNPTSDKINIDFFVTTEGKTEFTLVNLYGQVLLSLSQTEFHRGKNTITLNLEHYPTGILLLISKVNNSLFENKIVHLNDL